MTLLDDSRLWERIRGLKGETILTIDRKKANKILEVNNERVVIENRKTAPTKKDIILFYHCLKKRGILTKENIPEEFFLRKIARIILAILAEAVPEEIEGFERGKDPRFPTLSGIRVKR